MNYIKGILSGVAAVLLAELVPMFRSVSGTKATGLAVFTYGLVESIFSPLFWVMAMVFFVLFFAASRVANKGLRVLLFWIPTLAVFSFSLALAALVTYLFIRFRHS